MTSNHSRREGIYRDDAGTTDAEGFLAPSTGWVEHALYFTSSPDVLVKTRQLIDQQRLELPGAVVVWDETVGRRTGAKAVPGAWWAGNGSLTMSLVFAGLAADRAGAYTDEVASAALAAMASFSSRSAVSYDGAGTFMLDGKPVGMLHNERYGGAAVFVIRINCNTDYSKALSTVRDRHAHLVDYIDTTTLPLGKPGTLPNTLALELMKRIPRALERRAQ